MYILGIHDGHNASACLLKDGTVVAYVSEERFTRVKNQRGFPTQSISWCLQDENITGSDLDRIGLAAHHVPIIDLADPSTVTSWGDRILRESSKIERTLPPEWGGALYGIFGYTSRQVLLRDRIKHVSKFLKVPEKKIDVVDHHTAHAYSAYYASPLREDGTAVLTLDAEGDGLCSTVSVVKNGNLERIASTPYFSSLGWIYGATTQFLGMKPNEHEYKVMGLAPYAYPNDTERVFGKIESLIRLRDHSSFTSTINTRYTLDWMKHNISSYRFDWIAGAVQKLCEQRMVEWVTGITEKYGFRKFAVGGGVFLNVKANMLLLQLPSVDEIFFLPSCGDESLAMGAAFFAQTSIGDGHHIAPLKSLYLGPEYAVTETELAEIKSKSGVVVEHHADIENTVADLLVKGEIVARFSGRMEWGARALGNRSIMTRADDSEVVDVINRMIKQRDFWMPFAPTILHERESDYIINPKKASAPYMILAFPSTPMGQKHLRAAMHPADKTLRPQLLEKDWNPAYHTILKGFEKSTGFGGILNTSFNLHGEPIVCTPTDAISTFMRSGLQNLAIGDFLIKKTTGIIG
jgi:carbamoyltransferase